MRKIFTIICCTLLATGIRPAAAQQYSPETSYQTVNRFYDDTLVKKHFWIEVDLLMNPIYISQFSSKYALNGHSLHIKPAPMFYGALPSQVPFSDLEETADQSNAIYANFGLRCFENSKLEFLHHIRLMAGLTHDKLQTGSNAVYYKFPSGGTELTAMVDYNVSHKLSDLDFRMVNLIFNFNVQAGVFASLANVYADIAIPDSTIKSVSDARWVWENKKFYLGGWGWLTAANAEIGGVLCHSYFITQKFTTGTGVGKVLFSVFRHIGLTVGARVMVEGLYTSPEVTLNGAAGYRLKVSNYGLFFTGPVISLKYIKF